MIWKTLGLFLLLAVAGAAAEPDFTPVTAKIQSWIDRGHYPGTALQAANPPPQTP